MYYKDSKQLKTFPTQKNSPVEIVRRVLKSVKKGKSCTLENDYHLTLLFSSRKISTHARTHPGSGVARPHQFATSDLSLLFLSFSARLPHLPSPPRNHRFFVPSIEEDAAMAWTACRRSHRRRALPLPIGCGRACGRVAARPEEAAWPCGSSGCRWTAARGELAGR